MSDNRYEVRAAARVLDILDLQQRRADGMTLADVVDATGLPKSSAFRYRSTGMPQRTGRTITDSDQDARVIEAVARDGYAVDDRENEEDDRCVAVPLTGLPVPAAVSLSAPANRLTVEAAVAAANVLRRAAVEIARRAGGDL